MRARLTPVQALLHGRYQLMMARLQAANIEQAKAELKETTSMAPCFTGTVLALASSTS